MAIEFNVTAAHKFFLGEDKILELTIFGQDNVTPFDIAGLPLEWNLRKTDGASDPALITKGIGSGLTVVGTYNVDPVANTQRVRIAYASDDTDPLVTSVLVTNAYKLKAGVAYRHSLKRKDSGNEGIFTYGSFTFLQATER